MANQPIEKRIKRAILVRFSHVLLCAATTTVTVALFHDTDTVISFYSFLNTTPGMILVACFMISCFVFETYKLRKVILRAQELKCKAFILTSQYVYQLMITISLIIAFVYTVITNGLF